MQTYQTKPAKPNLPNQTYKTKPAKQNLQNHAYHTKPTKPNQTILNVACQAYWTRPTKPKLLVKAVNTWVRSAFGNISFFHSHQDGFNQMPDSYLD